MKTQDFMNALGGINEKYLKDLLDEPAKNAVSEHPGNAADSGVQAVSEPIPAAGSRSAGSRIIRYVILAASAAACIGGLSLLAIFGSQKPDPLNVNSECAELTDATAGTTTEPVTETTVTVLTSTAVSTGQTTVTAGTVTAETAVTASASQTETTAAASAQTETQTEPESTESTGRTESEHTAAQTTVTETESSAQTETLPDEYNSVKVNCIDMLTGEPLEGVVLSLIESPNHDAKQIASWVSDSTGTHTFAGLTLTGDQWDPPYVIRVEQVPEGYSGGYEEIVTWPYIYGYTQETTYFFISDSMPKTISMSIHDADDGTVLNDLTYYELYWIDPADITGKTSVRLYDKIMPDEQIALPDGSYFAYLNLKELQDKGYKGAKIFTDGYLEGYMISFTVTDGKPDKELIYFVQKK